VLVLAGKLALYPQAKKICSTEEFIGEIVNKHWMPSGNRDLPFNGGDHGSVGPGKSQAFQGMR